MRWPQLSVIYWAAAACQLNRFGGRDCCCTLSHLYWTSHPAKLQMMQTNAFWSHFLLPPRQLEGIGIERETTVREISELVAQQKRNDRNLSLLLLMASLYNYIIRYFFFLSKFCFSSTFINLPMIPKSTQRRIKNLSLKYITINDVRFFFIVILVLYFYFSSQIDYRNRFLFFELFYYLYWCLCPSFSTSIAVVTMHVLVVSC